MEKFKDLSIADLEAMVRWIDSAFIFQEQKSKYEKLKYDMNQEISLRIHKLVE